MTTGWKRNEYGYWSPTGHAFIERGAPMDGGGTAWLIWIQIPDSLIDPNETREGRVYPAHSAPYGPLAPAVPFGPEAPDDYNRARTDAERYYIHTNDAGSLAEAKETVAVVCSVLRHRIAAARS